jgi:hypothetical protein
MNQRMIPMNKSLGMSLCLVGAAALFAACGDDYEPPPGNDCTVGDPVEGPTCECAGDECVCPGSGDCAILCVEGCGLQCAGSGDCAFDCVDGCDVSCTGSGSCDLEVGHDSTVACTGSGDCDITCYGDCDVACPGSGTCTIRCGDDFDCTFTGCAETGETCANGDVVCNGSC